MFSGIVLFALFLSTSNARGPLCLDCAAVPSPHACTRVKECSQNERCFGVHFLWANRQQGYSFGCRSHQSCFDNSDVAKRTEFHLCDLCCEGDLCNNNICTNGTVPPPGLPCVQCHGVTSDRGCTDLQHCHEGEACFAEQAGSAPARFNLGCAPKAACDFYNHEIVGKRSAFDDGRQTTCHKCCAIPGCNHGVCSNTNTLTTQSVIQTTALPIVHSCWELKTLRNASVTGWYDVHSPAGNITRVYCDMTTDGGGWMVIQRRVDGSVDFSRSFMAYSHGFGNDREFWFGNENLHTWTIGGQSLMLRVDLCDWENSTRYATYGTFAVGGKEDYYRVFVTGYTGNAGDAFISGGRESDVMNGQRFSTPDSDHDNGVMHCAFFFASGWWFNNCYRANLNGIYLSGAIDSDDGVQWKPWQNDYSLKTTEMKLRPADAVPTNHEPFTCP